MTGILARLTRRNDDLLGRWMRDEDIQRHLKEHPQDKLVGYKDGREVTKGATVVCLATDHPGYGRVVEPLQHPDYISHLGKASIHEGGLVVFDKAVGAFLRLRRVKALTIDIDLIEFDDDETETVADVGFYPASLRKAGASPVRYGCDRTTALFPSLAGLSGEAIVGWDPDNQCLSGGF